MTTRLALGGVVAIGLVLIAGAGMPRASLQEPVQTVLALAPPAGESTTGAKVVATMAKVYAECSSYRDSGTVTTRFPGSDISQLRKAFETGFSRTNGLRFEHKNSSGKSTIFWTDGKSTKYWSPHRSEVSEPSSPGWGLAMAGAALGRLQPAIPRLLLPPDGTASSSLAALEEAGCEGTEDVASRSCFRIAGRAPDGDAVLLWIDKETYLLRQVLSVHEASGGEPRTETITTYAPELNVAIEPAELAFDPPATPAAGPRSDR